MDTLTLSNETLRMQFDRATGSLVGLTSVAGGWHILDRPHLGMSFRLLVPSRGSEDWHAQGRRNNPVLGEKQKLTSLEAAADGRRARFVWNGVTSEHGGRLDIRLTLEISLDERQAVYALTIDNRSRFLIESAACPCLGDVQPPPAEEWLKTFLCGYATAVEWPLWPTFQNLRGYYGFDHPIQAAPGTPVSPFILLRGARQGLYVGVRAPSPELVAWQAELSPGYGSSIDSRVPRRRRIGGKDVATRFAAVHVPYIAPGETRTLTPIAMEAFQGGWQHGVDIYKAWRRTWMTTPAVPGWAAEPHAWQQIHINSPEDELRVPFRELARVGEECVRNGVRAIQLVGWNDGGQDQGNPSHDPDPRLGTARELEESITACQAMGVKVVLFAKFTWADRATARFRDALVTQAVKDPYGDYYHYQGYQYQTAAQMLDINTKRLVPMCLLSEEYLRVCGEEFAKTVALGADGILYDECQHHSPALLCFDERHGHRYGSPVYANDRELIRRFSSISRAANPEFLFAGEACYDWEMEAYHLAYFRSWSRDHVPLSRYLLPDAPMMTAVNGFDDRNMINQCLLYRYLISYEPYNFKGRLDDFPLTIEYGRKMDALRTELREFFWDGEFRHEVGARVTAEGQSHHPYAVFVSRSTGRAGVAVANYDEAASVTVHVHMESGQRLGRYRLVDNTQWRPAQDGITIPPCSAAVVIG